jgi:hypothetical protein
MAVVSAVNQFEIGVGVATVETLGGQTKQMTCADLKCETLAIHEAIRRDGVYADKPESTALTCFAGPPAYYEVPIKLGGATFVMRMTMGENTKFKRADDVWCDSLIDCL